MPVIGTTTTIPVEWREDHLVGEQRSANHVMFEDGVLKSLTNDFRRFAIFRLQLFIPFDLFTIFRIRVIAGVPWESTYGVDGMLSISFWNDAGDDNHYLLVVAAAFAASSCFKIPVPAICILLVTLKYTFSISSLVGMTNRIWFTSIWLPSPISNRGNP